jgi:small subunit ribosomal protein S2
VTEARKLDIPVIGTGDTNVDPDDLDFIIPANDDAIRAIRLLCGVIASAAVAGQADRSTRLEAEPEIVTGSVDETAGEELLSALAAGGGTLTFEPEPEDDALLPEASGAPGRGRRPAVTVDEDELLAAPPAVA